MVFCWEADLQGRQGRRASRAKPGRGAGRVAAVESWRAGKGQGELQPEAPRWQGVGRGSEGGGGPGGRGGMPRAKRARAMPGREQGEEESSGWGAEGQGPRPWPR